MLGDKERVKLTRSELEGTNKERPSASGRLRTPLRKLAPQREGLTPDPLSPWVSDEGLPVVVVLQNHDLVLMFRAGVGRKAHHQRVERTTVVVLPRVVRIRAERAREGYKSGLVAAIKSKNIKRRGQGRESVRELTPPSRPYPHSPSLRSCQLLEIGGWVLTVSKGSQPATAYPTRR